METSLKQIQREGIIAIVRGQFRPQQLLVIGETLATAGLTILEITLNTSDAFRAIEQLRQRAEGRLLVGAGTVRTPEQLRQAMDAGAQFSVAPNFDAETVRLALSQHFLHLPGVFTATEAETAVRAGCALLKLFPSEMLGPRYLKALRAPLDDVKFVPTGGISAANIGEYRRAGAVACGIGSALVTDPAQPLAELSERARALRHAWEAAS
jgi:2-dehydro-3-deoxyphosphogluconate aldolase/(4S)-4-hydroxy-2-oxoglutarate aldolase